MKTVLLTFVATLFFLSCSKPTQFNVMTFNVRLDNEGDSINNWQYRKDAAAKLVRIYDVDIMGAQEVLKNQLNDFLERLPEYNSVGVGREDGVDKGEFSPLLYKKNRFKEEKSGTFWISETPDVPGSMGWDASYPRVASWAILKDRSGKRVFAINTHLDNDGLTARREGANLIISKIKELSGGLPVILTGDFNDIPTSEAVNIITEAKDAEHLVNSKSIAKGVSGTDWTFHDFGRLPMNERDCLDYIFVSSPINVLDYVVLADTLDNVFVSDHKPVFVKLLIK